MHIHLLGFSEGTICRILDTLLLLEHRNEVIIVQNIELPETIPYCPPGIRCKKIFWDKWQFDPSDHICLPGLTKSKEKKIVVDFFMEKKGIESQHYFSLVHPFSSLPTSFKSGNACFIEPGSVVAPFSEFGFGVHINRGCTIGHHTLLGDYVSINPGVHISGHCTLGEGVQIGAGSVVFDHIRIGKQSIIGGGSVVTKDIPPGVIAWGNPCKVIKNIAE